MAAVMAAAMMTAKQPVKDTHLCSPGVEGKTDRR
jgi:hypothetical protein